MAELFLDISEEYISINFEGRHSISNIKSEEIYLDPKSAASELKEFLANKEYQEHKDIILTVPVKDINHQIITLPEDIEDKQKEIFLKVEIDRARITPRFNYQKLEVTSREEEEEKVCDYIVFSLKPKLYEKLEAFIKLSGLEILAIVPSFFLLKPSLSEALSATAWVGNDRTEIVIWGQDNPLSLVAIENTGDQMGDINRFITQYFDQISGVELSKIRLYGPKMRDESITFSLSFPNEIIEEPRLALAKVLNQAHNYLDISVQTKLASPPLELNPRNIALLSASLLAIIFLLVGSFFYVDNLNKDSKATVLRTEVEQSKKLLIKSKQMEREIVELGKEKDFFLKITKRRTPWRLILDELAKLTPENLWIERMSASKATIQLSGKAERPEDVSDLEINFNNSSVYFKEAQVIGVRDYFENSRKFAEFQTIVKLTSPLEREENQ
jgi:Tfp pilus assembly protein PilN